MRPAFDPTVHPDAHLLNLLGAFVSTVQDRIAGAFHIETDGGGAAPAAVLALATWPGCSIDFLSSVLGLTHSGTVRLVGRLGTEGIVEKGRGDDGRTAALRLTARGRARARRLHRVRYDVLEDALSGSDVRERAALGDFLTRALRRGPRTRIEAQAACRTCDHTVCRGDACPIGSSVDG